MWLVLKWLSLPPHHAGCQSKVVKEVNGRLLMNEYVGVKLQNLKTGFKPENLMAGLKPENLRQGSNRRIQTGES